MMTSFVLKLYVYINQEQFEFRETEEPINEAEKTVDAEKQLGQEDSGDANKENPENEPEEKEPEEKVTILSENIRYPCLQVFIILFPGVSCSCLKCIVQSHKLIGWEKVKYKNLVQ